jgi:hypothetical protein
MPNGQNELAFKMPSIANKIALKRSGNQGEEFELYEGSARFKVV